MDAVLLLRLIERCLAVAIGGFSIFFGYRLFLALPEIRDASGKISLPMNIRIVVSRVGPGVFFALFGAGIVALSLYRSIDYERSASGSPSVAESSTHEKFAGLGDNVSQNDAEERANARALLRRDFAALNTLPRLLKPDLPPQDLDALAAATERVKLSLMRPVWGGPEEGWGDEPSFEAWVRDGQPSRSQHRWSNRPDYSSTERQEADHEAVEVCPTLLRFGAVADRAGPGGQHVGPL